MKCDWLFWLGLLLCLAVPNGMLARKQSFIARGGTTLYLEFAPHSNYPGTRSMKLYYALAGGYQTCNWPFPGWLNAEVDERGRILTWKPEAPLPSSPVPYPTPVAPGKNTQVRLRYTVKDGRLRVGPDTFTYLDGQGSRYSNARYAVLLLLENGDLHITGLADQDLRKL